MSRPRDFLAPLQEPALATYAQVPAVLDFFVTNAEGPSAAIIRLAADVADGPAAPPAVRVKSLLSLFAVHVN